MKIVYIVFLLIGLNAGVNAKAERVCHEIRSHSNEVIASQCESKNDYEFYFGSTERVFSKDDFEQRINGAIANWWLGHGRSIRDLQGAQLRIWLTLPESSPSAASGRVEVWSKAGNFTLSFDLLASEWAFVDSNAGMLGVNATYPKSYGWRPHDILLSLEAGVSIADVEDTIRSLNLDLIGLVSPGWYHLRAEFFKEHVSVEALRSDGRLVHKIRSVQLNNLTEWIGYRGSGIQFKWREK